MTITDSKPRDALPGVTWILQSASNYALKIMELMSRMFITIAITFFKNVGADFHVPRLNGHPVEARSDQNLVLNEKHFFHFFQIIQ